MKSLKELYTLWDRLPVNAPLASSKLDEAFLHFEKGTSMSDVFKWFEEQNRDFVVEEVKAGIRHKLPSIAYKTNPKDGTFSTNAPLVAFKRGESGYYPINSNASAVELNERRGVTKAQVSAMYMGSLFGWDVPGADPDLYNDDGSMKRLRYEVQTRMMGQPEDTFENVWTQDGEPLNYGSEAEAQTALDEHLAMLRASGNEDEADNYGYKIVQVWV